MSVAKRQYAARNHGTRSKRCQVRIKSAEYFFDRQKIIDIVGETTAKTMREIGSRTMYLDRRMQKKRVAPSKPGEPPHAHTGLLRRMTYFYYSPEQGRLIVGAEKLDLPGDVPHSLEYGRGYQTERNPRRVKKNVGDAGIILVAGTRIRGANGKYIKRNEVPDYYRRVRNRNGRNVWVVYAKLTSAEMVRRNREIQEELFGPTKIRGRILPRPHINIAGQTVVKNFGQIVKAASK